ncbi:MAG: metal-sulfur cluster assembly factor [Gemmatimonadales bacterium]
MLTEDELKKVLRSVKDPELDLNIIDLGLVYDVVNDEGNVSVKMTLTSPGCPAGPEIVGDVERCLMAIDGVAGVDVEIVWEPYWTPERIDPRIRAFLGM